MLSRVKSVGRRLLCPWAVYVAGCILAAGIVISLAFRWDQTVQAFDRRLQPDWSPSLPQQGSKRFFLDNDPYYWVSYAREMAETGKWRIRYTYADNVPYGREVHWSQSITWLLVLFGFLRHCWTGEPMFEAIEGASIWVNPSLLILFTFIFSWVICRRMGVGAAVIFALTLVTLPDMGWNFQAFRPDHHGLHLAFSLGTLVCLILGGLGWVGKDRPHADANQESGPNFFRPLTLPNRGQARRYFLAAGVFTGLGLWTGATVQFFCIGAIAVGSVSLALFMPSRLTDEHSDYLPQLWRVWAVCAAVVGMTFYLIEYFPTHLAMRLEVNHPLYALTILCVGELMVRLTQWRLGDNRRRGVAWWVINAVLVAGIGLVPLLITIGPPSWHNLRDVQMARMHNFILEFYTYLNFRPESPLTSWFVSYGILPFFIVGALALSGPRRTQLYEWAGLWLSFFLCVLFLLLTLWQVRWAGIYAVMNVWLMIIVGHIVWRNVLSVSPSKRDTVTPTLVSGLILVQAAVFAGREYSMLNEIRQGRDLPKDFVDAAMKKHLAQALGAQTQGKELRVICEPDLAPSLHYFAGISSVTSYYWENLQGVHEATEFFADRGDAAARQVAKNRGLTHAIVPSDDRLPVIFNYIETGSMDIADAGQTLLQRLYLGGRGVPPWIVEDRPLTRIGRREFKYKGPRGTGSIRSTITIYHLDPANSPQQVSPGRSPASP